MLQTLTDELLLFKRRPRFTSKKISVTLTSKKISESCIDFIKTNRRAQKVWNYFSGMLAGALCDNSQKYFFIRPNYIKKYLVEWNHRSVWSEAFKDTSTLDQTSYRIEVRSDSQIETFQNRIRSERAHYGVPVLERDASLKRWVAALPHFSKVMSSYRTRVGFFDASIYFAFKSFRSFV